MSSSTSLPKIKVVIADDYLLLRTAWKLLLQTNPCFEVVGMTADGQSTINFVKLHSVDVILMDINMPGINGIEATEKIGNIAPWIRIIGLSLHNEFHYVNKILKAGAKGFVTKSAGKEELFKAILDVYNNVPYVSPSISHKLITNEEGSSGAVAGSELTARELDVIKHIVVGKTCRQIGQELCISAKTVEAHKYNIFKKLCVNNSASLTKKVMEEGIVAFNTPR